MKYGLPLRHPNTKSMEQSNLNLSTDFVQDMLAESPAKEPKAVVADRTPKLSKNVHWAVKGIKTIFVY